ncbi:hypothetical protein HPB49_004650 [Dermacentor silvarum]|uniref:Uncharacterized protein n=1 Tax=Dermacentor silvarum TaxID=543639 RepID=A0ACB8DBD6_DERSI|nr:hypothetical protein HPB49_004650 [Dermacentor silvarum]
MAVTALRGYGPTTLAWKNGVASTPEDSVPLTDIVDEGLFTVMTLHKRRQQSNAAKTSDTDEVSEATTPHNDVSDDPTQEEDIPCIAAARHYAPHCCGRLRHRAQASSYGGSQSCLPASGEVCRGVITVHEQETSASLKAKIHWRGGNIAFIRKLGKTSVALLTFERHHVPRFVHYKSVVTPWTTARSCAPTPTNQRCGHCGQVVGASEEGMTPHECKPSCLVCGEEHFNGSPAFKANFRRLQHTGGQHGGRGSPQQRPKPKTSDVTPEGRQPGATNQTPKTNQQVPHSPKTSQASQKTLSKTPDQGAPVFQAGEFPPLTSAGAPWQPAKKTSSQNAQLLAKIATLEAGSMPSTPASPPPPLPKITVAVPEPKPMCVALSVSEPSNTEQRFQAIESAMTSLVAQLTTTSKSIENLSNTVTHQVTSNIKTWLQDANSRSRRARPLKDVNRPSKFSYTIDLAELSGDSEPLLAQGNNGGAESTPATPNSQYGGST